jgi:Protein of unknown function (DUF4446)
VHLEPEVVQYVAVAAAGVGLLGLLVGVLAVASARKARRAVRAIPTGAAQLDEVVRQQLMAGLRRVGLVRYDALAEMGGRMSFSVALLDQNANGVVISAINGRTESRCYGKAVMGGAAEQELSPEEKEAIAQAMAGQAGDRR